MYRCLQLYLVFDEQQKRHLCLLTLAYYVRFEWIGENLIKTLVHQIWDFIFIYERCYYVYL